MCQQFFLLRHGEVDAQDVLLGQKLDPSLSAEGRKAIEKWMPILQKVPFQAIITSPARRSRETAELLAPAGVPILQLPHFHEVSWGKWEGLPHEEARPLLHQQAERWAEGDMDWAPPEGESLRSIFTRIEEGLRFVSTLYPVGSVLIVTHGQLLRLLLAHVLGYPFSEQKRFYHKRGELSWLVRLPAGFFYAKALAVNADTAF
ncbi:MAG: histidine phosphatase family protein [Bacteroidia bacterium]|nr:histidine phosphatase family protein [Bacteroidia bacterium]MCX7764508.1 histidine phosphatase family protein [Bacteroidia bacterium]MDW8056962.1 histidine phosphatase family protein [Bacteroidia bacterium]